MKLHLRLIQETRLSRPALVISIFLGVAGGIGGILQAREISRLINRVFLQGMAFEAAGGIFTSLLVIVLLRAGLTWGSDYLAGAAARKIKQALRQRLFTHLMSLGPAYLRGEAGETGTQTGELVNTATEGIDALEAYYSQYLPQVALAAMVPLSILFFVFPADLLSGVVLLVTAPLLPLFMYLVGSLAQSLTRKQWRSLSRMSAYFLDVLQGLTTLKALGRSREQAHSIRRVSEQHRLTTMGVLRFTFLSALVLELVATLGTAVVAVEIGIRLLYGRMAFEQAFFVLLLAPEFYQPLRMLGLRFHASMAGVEAARRIYQVLDLPVEIPAAALSSGETESVPAASAPSIQIKNISYLYAGDQAALTEITLDIPAGKMTALAGESGAGKTTLTWLLLRFLDAQSGEILVDGKPLAEIPAAQWWDNLAWVPQNPHLFNATVAANIRLADPEADDASVRKAAQLAHADEFIRKLASGYETIIGEGGARLSAGQAQRIALARAFLKDAPLLILDEATSHLDPQLDEQLRESLKLLRQGRTVVVIAHHQSTLNMADQVIHLRRGRLERIEPGKAQPVRATMRAQMKETGNNHQANMALPAKEEGIHARAPRQVGRRLLGLMAPFAGRILISMLLGFATIMSSVGLMGAAAYIISAAALHPSIAEIQLAIVGVRFFGLSRGVFRYLERLVSHDVTFRLLAEWRVRFYQALEPLAPARFMQYHTGDLMSRVIGDISSLENFYVRAAAPPLVAVLVAVSVSVFLGAFGWELSAVLAIFLLLAGAGLPFLAYALTHQLGTQIIQARSNLSTVLVDGIQGMADILTSGQGKAYLRKVEQAGKTLTRLQGGLAMVSAAQNALGSLLANLGMLAVLAAAAGMVSEGRLEGVLLGVVALAALMSFEAMQPLPMAAQHYEANYTAAARLYELIDAEPQVRDPESPLEPPKTTHLDIHDLSFQYPAWSDENQVQGGFKLEDISFTVPEGGHIAIVGLSGSGKSTLISLLLRFWDYHQGSIQMDGKELRLVSPEDIRKRMAVISQHTYLFSTTIKENLLIARPTATQEEIVKATQAAQLHDKIASLPEGYRTWIGEHGMQLSAGERQRLALARALLREAPMLLLDEPTANLDPATEQAVLNSIRETCQDRSTVSITQRLTGMEAMDEIIVMKDGRIIEHGSHVELLARKGLYHQMWELYNQEF